MKNIYKRHGVIMTVYLFLSCIRLIPHIIILNLHPNKKTIIYDIKRWLKLIRIDLKSYSGFIYLMTFFPEYRNLFYYRIGHFSIGINKLCPRLNTLYLNTKEIGPGLFIQHGFATIIDAKSIGKDCWINQQVTIGYSNATDRPILGDNVVVRAGAKVIGKVYMGNNSIAGANAVVGGSPAKVLKYRFDEKRIEDLLKSKWWEWTKEEIKTKMIL